MNSKECLESDQQLMTDSTEVRPTPTEHPPVDEASFSDVKETVGSWSKGMRRRSKTFFSAHGRTFVVLGIAVLIVGFMIVLSSLRSADKPSVNQASTDVANLSCTPSYDAGDYGWIEAVSLSSVDFVEVEREPNTCTATGDLIYSSEHVTAKQQVELTYVRANNGGWMTSGIAKPTRITWSTQGGADPDRVLSQASILLQRADIQARTATETSGAETSTESSQTQSDSTLSLYNLYRNATCTLKSEEYNEEELTDTLVLHFDDEGTFVSHSCDLTVVLRFHVTTGAWSLSSCTADEHAFDANYDALVGNWQGSFTTQENDGNGCFAAREVTLELSIDAVAIGSDGVVNISGSFGALVHHHGSLSTDANSTVGDEVIQGESFSGVLEEGPYGHTCSCTTPESADRMLRLDLSFGTEGSADAAQATLVTTYEKNESFLFIPYQVQGTFADSYTLTKPSSE